MMIQELIVALGDTTAVARALGEPITTVQSWKTKGRIPRWRQAAVADLARASGVPCDFTTDVASAPRAPVAAADVRIVTCSVCDLRLDDRTVRGCQALDCPQAERDAA
jgi:hypothetical protein